jgi:hypothetical protein
MTPRTVSQDQADLSGRSAGRSAPARAITFSERTEPPRPSRARRPPERVDRHLGSYFAFECQPVSNSGAPDAAGSTA